MDDVEFGKLLGYGSAGSISMLQKRTSPPPYDRVVEIARLTGTDPGWLAFGADSQAPMEKKWPKLATRSIPIADVTAQEPRRKKNGG